MLLPCNAIAMPCYCHPRACHATTTMLLPCYCHATAMRLPCCYHATAMLLPCYCHAAARLLPCYRPRLGLATSLQPCDDLLHDLVHDPLELPPLVVDRPALLMSCYCHCHPTAMLLPCYCHATAMTCYCLATALPLPHGHIKISSESPLQLPLPLRILPSSCFEDRELRLLVGSGCPAPTHQDLQGGLHIVLSHHAGTKSGRGAEGEGGWPHTKRSAEQLRIAWDRPGQPRIA